jgi:hypothetical protein
MQHILLKVETIFKYGSFNKAWQASSTPTHTYVQGQERGYIVCEKHEYSQYNNMFLDLIYTARLHTHIMSQKWISTI